MISISQRDSVKHPIYEFRIIHSVGSLHHECDGLENLHKEGEPGDIMEQSASKSKTIMSLVSSHRLLCLCKLLYRMNLEILIFEEQVGNDRLKFCCRVFKASSVDVHQTDKA